MLSLSAMIVILPACSSQKHSDLDQYIQNIKDQTKGRIEPLPEVKTYESEVYAASELRDPFTPYADEPSEELAEPGLTPDQNRSREELEAFPLDSLAFVGHIERGGNLWGLVQAPDESIHRVTVGEHLGKNYGEILNISETTIVLKEIIPNGSGGWIEREASLALTE